MEGEIDTQFVARLGSLSADRIVPELYRLRTPASPYRSAEIDGVRIDADSLDVPDTGERPLVIEGAGGLMVLLILAALAEEPVRAVLAEHPDEKTISLLAISVSHLGSTGIRSWNSRLDFKMNPAARAAE